MTRRADGPTALEVVAWLQMLIAAKVYRAITSAAARPAATATVTTTRASAEVALLGIDRSRAAIQEMRQEDDDVRLDDMGAQLRRLARELEARFPDARLYVRRGTRRLIADGTDGGLPSGD